jgi:alpha-L-fucosidase
MDKPVFDKAAHKRRMEWFTAARFGMFIHWGLYAIPARGEWYKGSMKVPEQEYQKYFDEFDPTGYKPAEWAKIAKNAGMKYAVLTAKHHDGFCLFDSKLTDYKATNTKAGRDLVREYVDAFRAEGLKVGIYYSIIDWHHPDFPHYSDSIHPRRGDPEYKDHKENFDNYLTYMHGQVKELCSNYGKIDILWFDYSYDNLCGETWKATELIKMVRSLQPDVIIDNRLEGTTTSSLLTETPEYYSGDFISPEQLLPPAGMFDLAGNRVPWEACITMNNNWGYNAKDKFYKSAPMLIRKLVECVSKGGNLLLNVGPDAKGRIPDESIERLRQVGKWMEKNSDSIYGCGYAEIEKPDYGRVTRNGNRLYFHIMENTIGLLPVLGIDKDRIEKIRRVADGSEIKTAADDWRTWHYKDVVFLNISDGPDLPDDIDTVIEVTLKS